ncbi:MAG: response regulator [Acidobacteriota bacterium]|nr:response regulator [Acidobacteriota bacterium]MDH3784781.1 response regulator [Acidobacteriota bacterium]
MTPRRILVAEDDPVTRRFVVTLLTRESFEVREAEDGESAWTQMESWRPDLVVTDVVMPYLDGFDLLRRAKSNATLRDIPIVVLSMKDREEDIVAGLEAGAEDYIVKPFHARELVVRIQKILARIGGGR